jgi:hypothetical protein
MSAPSLQAKFFTESRLLQRHVRVEVLSLPTSAATPFQSGGTTAAPPSAGVVIGTGTGILFSPSSRRLHLVQLRNSPSSGGQRSRAPRCRWSSPRRRLARRAARERRGNGASPRRRKFRQAKTRGSVRHCDDHVDGSTWRHNGEQW